MKIILQPNDNEVIEVDRNEGKAVEVKVYTPPERVKFARRRDGCEYLKVGVKIGRSEIWSWHLLLSKSCACLSMRLNLQLSGVLRVGNSILNIGKFFRLKFFIAIFR